MQESHNDLGAEHSRRGWGTADAKAPRQLCLVYLRKKKGAEYLAIRQGEMKLQKKAETTAIIRNQSYFESYKV